MRNLKKVLALVLALVMAMSLMVTAGATSLGDYKDSESVTPAYATAVDVATQLSILEGVGGDRYAPQGNLTRAQLATMTYRIATGDVTDVYTANFAGGAAESFTDTPADAWYAGYVGYAADAGYLKGVGDGLYKPNSYMTGYQALAAFLRAIGYNQPGQFTGPDWTVQVAQIANQIGALDGITKVDLNQAITREVAAQIIYNILFADNVEYTPAFGYQSLGGIYGTLAENEFDLVTGKDGWNANIAPWGRPATVWCTEDEIAVTIMATPVATYTTAITECNLSKDLGETGTWEALRWLNGDDSYIDIVATNTRTDVADTDQGTLTEVYLVDDEYQIVEIETWLAKVTDVDKATYDKNGHEKTPANTEFTVYTDLAGVTETWNYETEAYAEGDYVLLKHSVMDEDIVIPDEWIELRSLVNEKYEIEEIIPTSPVATAALTDYNNALEQSVIGGKTYDWAAKYFEGNTGTVKTTYNVFVDEYGNLIGLVEPEVETVYTILDSGVKVTNGFTPYYAGLILDLSNATLDEVTVSKFENRGVNALTWRDDIVTDLSCIVSYSVTEDGYELETAATFWSMGGSVETGTPRVILDNPNAAGAKVVTDAETVYAVENADGVYTIYTGYKNVPSIDTNCKIEVLMGSDGYADLVYIDDTDAIYAAGETYAYVMPSVEKVGAGELPDGTAYNVYKNVVINGEVVKQLKVATKFDLTTAKGLGVELQIDAKGLVTSVVPEKYEDSYRWVIANDYSGDVVNFESNEKGYVVNDSTIIWIVDNAKVAAEAGSIADLTKGASCKVVLADDGVTLDKVIIFGDIAD